ncbi:MAG: LysR family transcriptional regulator [Burkholderiales bacterium]|jgi:DNA-binding transcriptional LysR family regulator
MELYQLRSFAAVAELGHLTRAAERLHVSQPALSAQIKALEDELAVVLFDRGAAGMTLTAAGRQLLPEAERVIAAAQSLRSHALALQGQVGGRLRMGTVADPELTRIADVLRLAVDRFPLLEIDVHHEISGAAFEKVREGGLDAAFYYGDRAHPAVASLPLRDLVFRIATPAAWAQRLAGASWETLASEPWIMTPPISTHHALAVDLFAAHGMAPSRSVEADHEAVISSLVAAGLGVALMREDLALADSAREAVTIWGDTRIITHLAFVYRREREHEPPIEALRDVVGNVWSVGTER